MLKEQLEIKVKRVGSSPYFHSHFIANEKKSPESINRLRMFECNQDLNEIAASNIIISNTHFKFSTDQLIHFKNCQLIVHSNSGYDNFDLEFIKNFNGDIIIGNQIRANAVASFILSGFFQFFSAIPKQTSWDSKRDFNRKALENLNIQIFGHGTIGKMVAKSLMLFNPQVKIYDPYENLFDQHEKNIDALILCCGYNQTNHHFINQKYLEKLNANSLIINPSRGELINTNHLINFLQNNPNAQAYLDVFEKEPNDFLAFKDLNNINTTSHIAGVFNGIEDKTIAFEKASIEDFIVLASTDFKKKYSKYILKNRIIGNQLI